MARLPWPQGGTGLLLLGCAAAAAVILRRGWRRRWPDGAGTGVRLAGGAALLTAFVLVAAMPPDRRGWPPPGWFLIMCDVGQGDALIVRAGPGEALVVDAGPAARCGGRLPGRGRHHGGAGGHPDPLPRRPRARPPRGAAVRSVAAVLATPIREPEEEAEAVDEVLATAGMAIEQVTAGDARSAEQWRMAHDLASSAHRRRILAATPVSS